MCTGMISGSSMLAAGGRRLHDLAGMFLAGWGICRTFVYVQIILHSIFHHLGFFLALSLIVAKKNTVSMGGDAYCCKTSCTALLAGL